MSADILSDKEVASLLKRAAAVLENPDLGAPGGDEDVPGLVEDIDETARAFDARRGLGENPAMFTVVGVYDDTGQVFADHVAATDAAAAMLTVAGKRSKDSLDCKIIGAIPGEHQLIVPSDVIAVSDISRDKRVLR